MKKLLLGFFSLFLILAHPSTISAAEVEYATPGLLHSMNCAVSRQLTIIRFNADNTPLDPCITSSLNNVNQNQTAYLSGKLPAPDANGIVYSPGVLGVQGKFVATLLNNQISSQEYVADILDNIGVPSISQAYAQGTSGGGTGYNAMKPFLEFWKVFRNLAYSLYIIMFVVVGIMIMLRTKVNAQTIITIQTALPNLLITLLLITFSYAIVGFMIDLMYFLIYFIVYLISSVGIIDASMSIKRLMSYSAWGVVFEGRNSIISAVTSSLQGILGSVGTGGVGLIGGALSTIDNAAQLLTFGMMSPLYVFVMISFVIAMLKLMVALVKSYIMIIVQTITAPMQILMNAMPGSKAFGTWLKTTASYLIPFPVAAAMFIFSAILIGNPKDVIVANDWWPGDATSGLGSSPALIGQKNPFGVKTIADGQEVWLPPFTLTDSLINRATPDNADILAIIGFFVFLMTPASVKMAQDWLQVKESPYSADAFSSATTGAGWATMPFKWGWGHQQEEMRMQRQAALFRGEKSGTIGGEPKNSYKQ